jgi:signal transduction histidine kinase
VKVNSMRNAVRSPSAAATALIVGGFFTAEEVLMDLARRRAELASQDAINGLEFWAVWAALTPIIVRACRRWSPVGAGVRRALRVHAVIALVLAVAHNVVTGIIAALVDATFAGHPFGESLRASTSGVAFVWGLFTGVLFYAVVLLLHTARTYSQLYDAGQRDAEALRAEMVQVKLDALTAQLRPHFLFNTLNAISVLVGEDSARAQRMILRLSALLRRSLDERTNEVALAEELAFTNDYLDIQRERFGERLSIVFEIDPAVTQARVPVFLLQPLVENAIEHGMSDRRQTTVTLRAMRDRDLLRLAIIDDGPGIAPERSRQDRVGLRSTRDRLTHLYGQRSAIDWRLAAPLSDSPGTLVEVSFPYRDSVA